MSLLDSIKAHYEDENYPPQGSELDYILADDGGEWVKGDTETELVSHRDLDQARWGTWFENVYQRGDEFVAIKDCRPATESQDWGDYGKPEIYEVKPRSEVVTVIHYDKVD